jgi:hypothetical protein
MGLRYVLYRHKIEPLKIQIIEQKKSQSHKYISFVLGTFLTISETLPFFKDVKANGLLDSFLQLWT